MKKLLVVAAVCGAFASAFVCSDAQAWGNDGHRAVGAIADQLIMGSNAEKRVRDLLLPGESLEKIATWADCIKGTYCGPQTAEMEAYVAANPRHSEYHYTNVPFQLSEYHDHAVGTADDDIVQTLKQCIVTLQGKGDSVSNPRNFTPRQALLILTHLTGDIAQPLHVGEAYVGKDGGFVVPAGQAQLDAGAAFATQGGNNLLLDDVKLGESSGRLIPPPEAENVDPPGPPRAPRTTRPLHSYWDGSVVNYAFRRIDARTPEQFAKLVIAANPAVAVDSGDPVGWPYQWAEQALAVSKLAYDGVVPGAMSTQTSKTTGAVYYTWPVSVPDDYPVPTSAAARTQLTRGGYHLAAVLKAIWP
ncbi:S1/P1 Nuclease [Duganella sp. CF517]|uniref:S1/P1 nuclease n=1 Tax=Duganella sp. CF517 TaxID=1881038 RepID=UPI0008BBA006|nr:S1/P1 nuclease [Duganella sp. CF517]SEN58985.1 S1/P1 Nuclease [Duganella sp. CF517]